MKEPRFTAQQIAFLLRHVGALHEPAAAAHEDSDVDPTTVSRPAESGPQASHAEPASAAALTAPLNGAEPAPPLASEIDIEASPIVSAAEHAAAVWPEANYDDVPASARDPRNGVAVGIEPGEGVAGDAAAEPVQAKAGAPGAHGVHGMHDPAPEASPIDIEEMLAEIAPRPAAIPTYEIATHETATHEVAPLAPSVASDPAAGGARTVGASLFDRLSHYASAAPGIGIDTAAAAHSELAPEHDAQVEVEVEQLKPQSEPAHIAQPAPRAAVESFEVAPPAEAELQPVIEPISQPTIEPIIEACAAGAAAVAGGTDSSTIGRSDTGSPPAPEPQLAALSPSEPAPELSAQANTGPSPPDAIASEADGLSEDTPLFLRRGKDAAQASAAPVSAAMQAAPGGDEDGPVTAEVATLRTNSPAQIRERLRRKYPGLSEDEIERLYEIEVENSRLKLLVARLIVDKPAGSGDAAAADSVYEGDPPFPQTMSEGVGLVKEVAAQAAQRAETAIVQARTSVSAHAGELRERLRDATPVFAYVLRNPMSSGSAAIRAVRHRMAEYLSWPAMKSMFATARRRSRGRELLLAGILGGLAAGFAVGLWSSPLDEHAEASAPVDMRLLLSSGGAGSGILQKGWSRPQPWGVWMEGSDARIVIGFDGPSRGDVELLLEARAAPAKDAAPPLLIVSFNSVELGRWQLPKSDGDIRRHFIVPQKVFNRSTEAHLDFAMTGGEQKQSVFGVKSILVRDARLLGNFLGFVDGCETDAVQGWALADEIPVTVTASVNGAPLAAQFTSVERPDLAAPGLSTGAGFELKPATPLAAGTKVDVRFSNGRPLRGSPCEIK